VNPWNATWPMTEAMAAERIAAAFPELSHLPVRHLGAGWDDHVFRCGPDLLFHFPRRPVAVELLTTEGKVLPAIAPHLPAAVPAPSHACAADRDGRPFSGMPWIPGQTTCRVPPQRLDSAELARSLGRFLAALHSLATDVDGLVDDAYGRTDLPRRRRKLDDHLPLLRSRLGPRLDELLRLLDRLSRTPIPDHTAIVHGDLYARHVLIDDNGQLSGIIDWGDVHRGCPALDLAVAWSVVPQAHRSAFFAAYSGNEPVPGSWLAIARFRAAFHACMTLVYSDDIGDSALAAASMRALAAVLDDPGPGLSTT